MLRISVIICYSSIVIITYYAKKLHGTVCKPPQSLPYSFFSPSSPIPLMIYDATALEPLSSVSTNSSLITHTV